MNVSNIRSELGEGIYWSLSQKALFWLDINESKLFRAIGENVHCYQLTEKASCVLNVENNNVYLVSENGIFCFNIDLNERYSISKIPLRYDLDDYRSNDGVMLSNNLYLYGVMNNNPSKRDGAVIVSKNGIDSVVYEGIAIPNTFIRIPDTNSILISDSFEKKVYKFHFNSSWDTVLKKEIWLNLSDTNATPDGGCLSSDGCIFIAIWDGYRIMKLDINGIVLNEYTVPVPKPTSCVFNEDESKLYVTTAYEGMSKISLDRFPLSGSILTVNLNG
jgi:sugar lactone lactonase YvrE